MRPFSHPDTDPGSGPGPFSLPVPSPSAASPLRRRALAAVRPAVEWVLGLAALNKMYEEDARRPDPAHDARPFPERALAALGIRCVVASGDPEAIPREGPLVVVANHPFGGPDGLALLALLRPVRPDLRVLANHLMARIPEMAGLMFPVDPFGGRAAAERNAAPVRAAIRHLRGGGALALFPAGEVAHGAPGRLRPSEPPWSAAAARLVQRARPTVLPVFFEGGNSALFNLAGWLHPRLRTALLPREMLRRRGATLRVHLGTPIPFRRLQEFTDPADLAAYLMARTEILAARTAGPAAQVAGEPAPGDPVTPAVPAPDLAREIAALPPEQVLIETGPYTVAFARAAQAPRLLREIGRLREITFRAAGEGTGRALDLDRFDDFYVHLFVWNRATSEVVGAYRLGATDEILPRHGPGGLYTSTLFRFRPQLLEAIDPALELGRSFVRREYQRRHLPLTLLWRGIGQYVAARPRYRRLFGAVSISNAYGSETRRLLMSFLTLHYGLTDLGRLVEPRVPPRFAPDRSPAARRASAVVRDLESVDELVREIEADRKSMPVLLRQYLKLDARLLGFNIDPEFGDVLDGLMLVDLARVPRAILERFMGREGAAGFLDGGGPREASHC